jgi:hypothetical protein
MEGVMTRIIGMLALVGVGLVACDQSKAELESTKQQLTAVTTERDSFKSQLDQAKQQLAALQQQLDAAKAAQAAPPAAAPPAAAPDKKEEKHHAAKHEAAPVKETKNPEKAAEQKKVMNQM